MSVCAVRCAASVDVTQAENTRGEQQGWDSIVEYSAVYSMHVLYKHSDYQYAFLVVHKIPLIHFQEKTGKSFFSTCCLFTLQTALE